MRVERIERMERYITTHKSATMDELCEIFQVSKNTIRRDLKEILARGEFQKTYGGVRVVRSRLPLPFVERVNKNAEVKRRIARAAAQKVKSGDIIYIDSGTTTCHIVDELTDVEDVTILTHSLEVINRAVANPKLTVVSLAGMLNRKTFSFSCLHLSQSLKDYNIGKAFMSADGLTAVNGATQSTPAEFEVKHAVIAKSNEVFILVEYEKFDQVSLFTYCDLDGIDFVITDQAPAQDFTDALTNSGGTLCVV